jgi:hypothetical protein
MKRSPGRCPLTRQQMLDAYFIENRTRLLEVAAFLDRLGRSADGGAPDFREQALRQALGLLTTEEPGRVLALQCVFSDPTTEPLAQLDRKSATGAYDPAREA